MAITWKIRRQPPLRYALFGSSCCSVELVPLILQRYQTKRLGIVPARWIQDADVLVVAGPITKKLAPVIVELYEQMPPRRWLVAFSACACAGGPYHQSPTTIDSLDNLLPVDVFVPGNPPRPEALIDALLKVRALKYGTVRKKEKAAKHKT